MKYLKYQIPIVWLDTNVLLEIAKFKHQKNIGNIEKERAEKIYNLIKKNVNLEKVVCIESSQKEEINKNNLDVFSVIDELTKKVKINSEGSIKDAQLFRMMSCFCDKKDFYLSAADIFINSDHKNNANIDNKSLNTDQFLQYTSKSKCRTHKKMQSVKKSVSKKLFNEQFNEEVGAHYKFLNDSLVRARDRIGTELGQDFYETFKVNRNMSMDNTALAGIRALNIVKKWVEISKILPVGDSFKKFYFSEEFTQIPYVDIQTRIFAYLLTDRSRNNIKKGDMRDAVNMGILLPYCDFIVTDEDMKNIIQKLELDKTYKTTVFSLQETENFINALSIK